MFRHSHIKNNATQSGVNSTSMYLSPQEKKELHEEFETKNNMKRHDRYQNICNKTKNLQLRQLQHKSYELGEVRKPYMTRPKYTKQKKDKMYLLSHLD